MTSTETTRSPKESPEYACHRIATGAIDTLPETNQARGINMRDHEYALIQVVPEGAVANPSVKVLWWSDETGAFIEEHTPITKAGTGAGAEYEFSVQCLGRTMFVAVTAGIAAGQTVRIMVAGANVARV